MPIATIEMTRDAAYIVVMFRSSAERIVLPGDMRRCVWEVREGLPDDFLPFGTGAVGFSQPHPLYGKGWSSVSVRLRKDERGEPDLMPMLVAADWLRDRGWKVQPLGWCAKVMEGIGAA